ncbi:hypothetical protein [Chloracidobacterium aggregatum]|uniref:zinc ribbon domain-containing protein n=1 Tax=Chloracidobacterium aggregatum TaxID=2851959 RepID=UPI001B8C59B7|nr:hypothetical protein [Chloracidobacterium aggregatum]QUV89611.1 hypothetical protein J8C07_13195 [Chloracidobacterium sp. S]QUV92393.1 hypothetical protein J8C04_16010 [Chloracidobacterium sp. A]
MGLPADAASGRDCMLYGWWLVTSGLWLGMGFGMFRVQMEYKAKRYGTRLIITDPWHPSRCVCSAAVGKTKR